jgi:hypothetical protein
MYSCIAILLILFSCQQADLLADRQAYWPIWVNKVYTGAQAELAFSPALFDQNGGYTLREYGKFAPANVALEYTYLAVPGGIPGLANPPSKQFPLADTIAAEWIDDDTASIYFVTSTWAFFNVTGNNDYFVKAYGFVSNHYIYYYPNSSLVKYAYSISDPGANSIQVLNANAVPASTICFGFVVPYCNRTWNVTNISYWADTGYTSAFDCIAKLSALAAAGSICPFPFTSKTPICIFLHAGGSSRDPSVHCQHTNSVSSHTCQESCLPACANMSPNAFCAATYPGFPDAGLASTTPVYVPTCKNGYIGDGFTCTALTANNAGKCPAREGTYTVSNTSLCLCNRDFTPRPDLSGAPNSYCECPSPASIHMYNGAPVCVPRGRCLTDDYRQFCSEQNHEQVKCNASTNIYTPFGVCTCNYGFTGGIIAPCSCAPDRRIRPSDSLAGKVCLSATECTNNDDCTAPQVCTIPAGQFVGSCGARKRDFRL